MLKLKCVNIVSQTPEKLADFYEKVFEAPANQLVPGRWELPVESVTLVFSAARQPVVISPDSCGLEFQAENVDAQYARLAGLGLELAPPVTYPWGWRAIGFRDPDGNPISFVQQV